MKEIDKIVEDSFKNVPDFITKVGKDLYEVNSGTGMIVRTNSDGVKLFINALQIGLFGRTIPLESIPFNYTLLKKYDMIRPSDDSMSLYYRGDGYVIVTDDPMNTFVSEEQLKQSWYKV